MTTEQKAARRKLSLLELAQDLGNVSKACRSMGYSRQQFYEIRRNFQLYGAEGLLDRLPGPRSPHPNRVGEEVEAAILAHSLKYPTRGCLRVAQDLALEGIMVSSMGVRGVWIRNDLASRYQRLMRLERESRERKLELDEDQVMLLERFSPEFRERHIVTRGTGDLVAVDTFFVGTLKGIGKAYIQSVLDCFSRYAWARLYRSKMPMTAVHTLHNTVLPFFEEHGGHIRTVLSDNGREFCGRPDQHPYELFLQLEGIEHRTTRVRRPRSNGCIERFHRTLLDEPLRVAGRTTSYKSVEQMQEDVDRWLETYITKRPHQGRGMEARTPYQAFMDGLDWEEDTEEETPIEVA